MLRALTQSRQQRVSKKKAELGRPEISDLGLAGPPASLSPWKCPFTSPGLRFLMSKVMEMK